MSSAPAGQPPGGFELLGAAAAAAVEDWLGDGDGECPGGVWVGTTVGVGGVVNVGVVDGDLLGDGEPEDADALGDGLIA